MTKEVEFVDGLRVYSPHEKAPDFVKGAMQIEREKLITWLQGRSEDKIRLDIKESKGGNWYAAVSNWKPKGEQQPAPSGEFQDDDLPPF